MSWLPEQHEDQLQLAFRIIDNSFKSKVHSMEHEIRTLRLTTEDSAQQMAGLKKKNSNLECELMESHQRSQQLAEENKELFKTVSQLKKQILRLEELKKKVMSSLTDEESQSQDDTTAVVYMSDDYLRSAVPITSNLDAQTRNSMPTHISMQNSFSSSPGAGPSGGSPSMRITSPDRGAQEGGRATSPSGSSQVDGRMFFRTARRRLSYEAFNAFLSNIKRLNNHQQTRDETLEEAKKIFGPEHDDLYRDFVLLLNRHA